MSEKGDISKSNIGNKKKRRNKRQASSPLNDNSDQSVSTGEQRKQRKAKVKKCIQENKENNKESVSGYPFDINYTNYFQTMFSQSQPTPYNMTQPSFMGSPPPTQFGGTSFGIQATPPP